MPEDRATLTLERILQRVHPETELECVSQDGQGFDVEHRLLMPDGSVKYVHVVAHAVSDGSAASSWLER